MTLALERRSSPKVEQTTALGLFSLTSRRAALPLRAYSRFAIEGIGMRSHLNRARKLGTTSCTKVRSRKLFFEPLEDRRMLVTVSVAAWGDYGSESGSNVGFLITRDSSTPL